jgi:uncharacterized protein
VKQCGGFQLASGKTEELVVEGIGRDRRPWNAGEIRRRFLLHIRYSAGMDISSQLRKHTILLTRAGSRVYGIHKPTSDVDVKGIAVPSLEYVFGTEVFEQADKPMHFEQFIDLLSDDEREIIKTEKLEGTVYELRKFVKLALDANPNILDVLFCDDKDVLLSTKGGDLLRANRELFLSAKAKHTFSGYSAAQMKRIRTHRRWLMNPPTHKPTRAEYELPESTLIPADQLAAAEDMVQKKLDSWEFDLAATDPATVIHMMEQFRRTLSEIYAHDDEQAVKWRAATRAVGLDDNLLVILERERRYKHAMTEYKNYENWKETRNKDRAGLEAKYGYDTKHAAHLVRLMRMGSEILQEGKVKVCRTGIDADELRAIRDGAWTYDQLDEFFTREDERLRMLYDSRKYVVPHSPKRTEVVKLCVEVMREALVENRYL